MSLRELCVTDIHSSQSLLVLTLALSNHSEELRADDIIHLDVGELQS